MRKILALLIAIIIVGVVDAKPKQAEELDLRIGTYNVWADSARKGPIKKKRALETRSWENSKEAVAELIVKLDCDIIGLQEVSGTCRDDLKKLITFQKFVK